MAAELPSSVRPGLPVPRSRDAIPKVELRHEEVSFLLIPPKANVVLTPVESCHTIKSNSRLRNDSANPPMTSPAIHIRDLCKTYIVSERESGVMAALASLVHRQVEEIPAVDGISFD